MTTLCRNDWVEAFADDELSKAKIDLLKLPTTSFEKMTASGAPPAVDASRLLSPATLQALNRD